MSDRDMPPSREEVAAVRAAQDRIEARVRAAAGVIAGTHVYGYVTGSGECALKRPHVCLGQATTKCHDRFVCLPCLHLHKHDLERDGVGMEFAGVFPDGDENALEVPVNAGVDATMARVIADRDELVKMLHEVWAIANDRGGYTADQAREVMDRAKALLFDHGIKM